MTALTLRITGKIKLFSQGDYAPSRDGRSNPRPAKEDPTEDGHLSPDLMKIIAFEEAAGLKTIREGLKVYSPDNL